MNKIVRVISPCNKAAMDRALSEQGIGFDFEDFINKQGQHGTRVLIDSNYHTKFNDVIIHSYRDYVRNPLPFTNLFSEDVFSKIFETTEDSE